jgi:hypothetical protein
MHIFDSGYDLILHTEELLDVTQIADARVDVGRRQTVAFGMLHELDETIQVQYNRQRGSNISIFLELVYLHGLLNDFTQAVLRIRRQRYR